MNNEIREENEFLHELKNNLSICKGYIEIMRKESNSFPIHLQRIEKEIIKSIELIEGYKRQTFTSIKKETVNLSSLLEELVKELTPLYQNRGCVFLFHSKEDCIIEGDSLKLRQVFINLLKNSIEAKEKEQMTIIIEIQSIENRYKIIIKDDGCGMTPQEINKIKHNTYSTKGVGRGYGLSFCKAIIENHKGIIQVKSKKNEGTTMIISFPNNNQKCKLIYFL